MRRENFMTADVTDIKGIGPSKAETLAENGYESVEDIANADRDTLGEINGVGDERALEFIVEASNLVDESEDESEDKSEEFDLKPSEVGEELEEEEDEPDQEEDNSSDEEPESDDGPYEITVSFETDYQYHTFHEAMMRYYGDIYGSSQPKTDTIEEILEDLTEIEDSVYELTEAQLNTLHTAVKQARIDYQGKNMIDLMESLKEIEEQINDQRRELLF